MFDDFWGRPVQTTKNTVTEEVNMNLDTVTEAIAKSGNENAKLIINKAIDAVLKSDTEYNKICKRIPKVEKMIQKNQELIDDYTNSSAATKSKMNQSTNFRKIFWSLFWGGWIGVIGYNINDVRRGKHIDKDFSEYERDITANDAEYAVKRSKEALKTLQDRKAKLEKTKKMNESTYTIEDAMREASNIIADCPKIVYPISREYDELIKENFDMSDYHSLEVLLGINEADQNRVVENLTSKLYEAIMNKAAEIDFGTIPASKGDITKIQGYEDLIECTNIMKGILIEYRQDITPVTTIQEAISNVQTRVDLWEKGFNLNADLPMVLYNSIVMAIVSSISLLIATSIEFIKDAGSDLYSIKLDKVAYVKNRDGLLFDNLKSFNKSCKNGELDRCLDHIFTGVKKQLMGTMSVLTVVSVVAGVGIIMNIVPIMRELVFFFYNTKQSLSDHFTIQADLIQMNAEYVKNNENIKTAAERKEIARKQQKIADNFRKTGNALTVSVKTGEKATKKDVEASKKKFKVDDVDGGEKFDSYQGDDSGSSLF